MKLSKNWDLIAILIISSLLIVFIYFMTINWLIMVFALPFLFFIPGYLLFNIYLLIKYNNKLMKKMSDEMELEKRYTFSHLILFSFGISIVFSPLILIITYLFLFFLGYKGVDVSLIILVIYFFILFFLLSILILRINSPVDLISINENNIRKKKNSITDIIFVILTAIMIISSIGLVIYIINKPSNDDPYTEFYILGDEETASEYPTKIENNKTNNLTIGIINHENNDITYTLILLLRPDENLSDDNIGHMNESLFFHYNEMSSINLYPNFPVFFNLSLRNEEEYHKSISFRINDNGKFLLEFYLFKNIDNLFNMKNETSLENSPLILRLWITVY